MKSQILKMLVTGIAIASSLTLGACGGGDDPSTPVPSVVTVKKAIPRGSNAALKEVEAVSFQPTFRILDIRCAFIFSAPANSITTGAPDFVLMLDVSTADVEKAKAYGFSTLTPQELALRQIQVCT